MVDAGDVVVDAVGIGSSRVTGHRHVACLSARTQPSHVSYVIVRPLSTVEYTSIASAFHSRQWSD